MPTPSRYTYKTGETRWRVRFRDGNSSASETFVAFKKAQEFCKLIDAVGGARARAIINEVDAPTIMKHTLNEVIDQWWEWKSARRADGSPKQVGTGYTLTRYEQLVRLHIRPYLGAKPVNLVSEHDIQAWVDQLSDTLAAKTVIDAHAILHAVYKWANARAQGLAVIDPCDETKLPAKSKNIAKGVKPDEWAILYDAAQQVSTNAADLLLFLVSSGWRWSEAVAVRSMDVDDFGTDGLWVSMGRVARRDGNTFTFVDDASKSRAGIRRIKMGADTADMIRRRIATAGAEDLVFTNDQGRKWSYAGFHSRYWTASVLKGEGPRRRRRILQVAADMGLSRAAELELHMLRHTHAVLMLLSGEPMAAVQKRLGHEDPRTTMGTYGSMIGDVSDESLDTLDAILSGKRTMSGLKTAALKT